MSQYRVNNPICLYGTEKRTVRQSDSAVATVELGNAPKPRLLCAVKKEPKDEEEAMVKDNITVPSPHDVLFGRSSGSINHSGNEAFKELIRKQMHNYVGSPHKEKGIVRQNIIDAVRSTHPPGRFLERNNRTMLWHDIGERKTFDKVSQALREEAGATVWLTPGEKKCPGNKLYYTSMEQEASRFVASGRLDTSPSVSKCVTKWRSREPPGCFVELDEEAGCFRDVGHEAALLWTYQELNGIADSFSKKRKREGEKSEDGEARSSAPLQVKQKDKEAGSEASVQVETQIFRQEPSIDANENTDDNTLSTKVVNKQAEQTESIEGGKNTSEDKFIIQETDNVSL